MKFLASDLDGTLVIANNLRSDKDIRAIENLRQKGHKFIISTGRSYNTVKPLIEKYNINYDYLLLCNGGLIINSNDEIIFDEWLSNKIAKEIISYYYNFDNNNVLMYLDDSKNSIFINNPNVVKDTVKDIMNFFKITEDISTIINRKDNYKILSLFTVDKDLDKAEAIRKKIINKYGEYVEACRNKHFIDVFPKDCSKGNALLQILKLENSKVDELYVVGDSFNDVPMFNITENSYTFHYAEDIVKNYAKNKVNYVYEVIDDLLGK